MKVLASTDDVPVLDKVIAQRRDQGLDTYDEWWEGVYVIVPGPRPEHGRITGRAFAFLDPMAAPRGLFVSTPVNVGSDQYDCRVPDLGVYRPDTPRTSEAFLSTAELVVEILSPGEPRGAKLDFYARHEVNEYLEIDLPRRALRLLRRSGDTWAPATESAVLGFRVEGDALVTGDGATYRVEWPPA